MGTKNKPGRFDCYANALPDEPMFTLLARDVDAPENVRLWAACRMLRIALGQAPASDTDTVHEALRCAELMEEWRKANDGAWRKPT